MPKNTVPIKKSIQYFFLLFHFIELIYIMNSPTNLTNYTKEFAEFRLTEMFSNFLGDQAQNIFGILENLYVDNIANNDYLGWLNFVVDVSDHIT